MKKLFLFILLATNIIKTKDAEKSVTIYHAFGHNGTMESVKQHGLLSFAEAVRKKLFTDPFLINRSGLLPDQNDNIYFDPIWRHSNTSENTVGYKVDPNTTYVYNREFRFDKDQGRYNSSRVLLAVYLANVAKAEEMKKTAPNGQVVIYNPFTSEPFYVNNNDRRYHDPNKHILSLESNWRLDYRHYLYLGEVIIKTPCINPANLIYFGEHKNPLYHKLKKYYVFNNPFN